MAHDVKRVNDAGGVGWSNKAYTTTPPLLKVGIDPATYTITFPGSNSTPMPANLIGSCGKFRVGWDTSNPNDAQYMNAKFTAIQAMMLSTAEAATDIMNTGTLDTSVMINGGYWATFSKPENFSDLAINQTVGNQLITAATKYLSDIADMRKAKANNYMSVAEQNAEFNKIYTDASAKGWAVAGEYYYALAKQTGGAAIDNDYYRIWTGTDSIQTARDLKPPPNLGNVANLYNAYQQFAINISKSLISLPGLNFLKAHVSPILQWIDYANDKYIQPDIADLNSTFCREDLPD